jgi:O-acetylhomoserine (thiol)-lyase
LVCHPRTTVHSELEPDELAKAGINESLIRISVGIEDWRDILHDIRQAMD